MAKVSKTLKTQSGDIIDISSDNLTTALAQALATVDHQTVKGNGTAFGANDAVNIVGGGATTVTGNASNKTITISTPSVTDTNQKVKTSSVTFGNDDVVEIKAGTNVTVAGDANAKTITISSTDTNTTYTFAEGTTNGAFSVTPSNSSAQSVSIHGLGVAAYKGTTTSVTSGSTDLVTSGAVYTAIDNLPEPMVFKGTLGTGGTITSLPTASSSNEGYTYKVITAGTYASQAAKIGDVFVSNGSAWVIIPAGDDVEDTWRNIKVNGTELLGSAISTGAVNFKNGSNVTISGSGNDITISSSYTDTNQKVTAKSNGSNVNFGSDATVELKAGSNVTITPNTSDNTITIAASQPTVNNGTLTISGEGTSATTFTANQSGNSSLNIKGGGRTTVSRTAAGEITISSTGDGNDNQTVKGNGTAFGVNDAVDIVGGGATTVTADTTNKKITISTPSVTDTNQKVKTSSVTFGTNDVVEIKAGSNVTVTGDASAKTITIAASQPTVNNGTLTISGNGTSATTFTANQSGNSSLNIKGSGGTTVSRTATGEITVSSTAVNNATLTITQNSTNVGTFTANASSNTSIDITTPQVMRFI